MPHIHTKPDQHDMTISAYIVRRENDEWKCLVHFHKKIEVLMQIGGHIELDETPWQAVMHELAEESGYSLDELKILQYTADRLNEAGNVTHPTPLAVNTHNVGNDHYHSDLCYGFLAKDLPKAAIAEDESADLRWLTIDELKKGTTDKSVLEDVVNIYDFLLRQINNMVLVDAKNYSIEKPAPHGITYKRGTPGGR